MSTSSIWRTLVALYRAANFSDRTNGIIFLAYVEQHLAPTLRPDEIVFMDNLFSHKKAGVRDAIESAGARLIYLPPSRPD